MLFALLAVVLKWAALFRNVVILIALLCRALHRSAIFCFAFHRVALFWFEAFSAAMQCLLYIDLRYIDLLCTASFSFCFCIAYLRFKLPFFCFVFGMLGYWGSGRRARPWGLEETAGLVLQGTRAQLTTRVASDRCFGETRSPFRQSRVGEYDNTLIGI